MKKINENTKVTLTLGQIKRLVKETANPSNDYVGKDSGDEYKDFEDVKTGDIGSVYGETPCIIRRKGTVGSFADSIPDAKETLEGFGEDHPAVWVEFFTGDDAVYVYDESGVLVPKDWGNLCYVNADARW